MTSVVVVGSGFTGFECARQLARKMRRHSNASVDISIISPVDYMLYTPLLPDVAGGLVDARFVAIPLANALRGVQAIRGQGGRRRLRRPHGDVHRPEERVRSLAWDRLVLTPGSVTRLFDIPGLAEHARGLKSTAEALYLRDHVLEQLELADVDDDAGRAEARRTVVVVGASYSGTELAVQLRALADSAAKQMGFDPVRGEVRPAGPGRAGDARSGREARRRSAAGAQSRVASTCGSVSHSPKSTPNTLCSAMTR